MEFLREVRRSRPVSTSVHQDGQAEGQNETRTLAWGGVPSISERGAGFNQGFVDESQEVGTTSESIIKQGHFQKLISCKQLDDYSMLTTLEHSAARPQTCRQTKLPDSDSR